MDSRITSRKQCYNVLNQTVRYILNDVKNKNEKVTEIFFHLRYAGIKGEQLVKHC